MRALQHRVDRNRYLPLMVAPALWPTYRARLARYAGVLGRLYAAIAAESGADVLVDSSKHVSTATLLRHVPGVDARVVQVVRDPRGVAASWAKVVERPDVTSSAGEPTMARLGAGRVAIRWVAYDALLELVRRPRAGGRLRYEAFVADPAGSVAALLRFAGGPGGGRPIEGSTVELGTDHTVAGNPLRFRTGATEIRRDDAWRDRLGERDRRIVTALTWPLRLAYGYR
jgi:hypothetical protein